MNPNNANTRDVFYTSVKYNVKPRRC